MSKSSSISDKDLRFIVYFTIKSFHSNGVRELTSFHMSGSLCIYANVRGFVQDSLSKLLPPVAARDSASEIIVSSLHPCGVILTAEMAAIEGSNSIFIVSKNAMSYP